METEVEKLKRQLAEIELQNDAAKMEMAKDLKNIRVALNLTGPGVARAMNMHPSRLVQIERGEIMPRRLVNRLMDFYTEQAAHKKCVSKLDLISNIEKGQAFEATRNHLALTSMQVAREIGVSMEVVIDIERGWIDRHAEAVSRIADFYLSYRPENSNVVSLLTFRERRILKSKWAGEIDKDQR